MRLLALLVLTLAGCDAGPDTQTPSQLQQRGDLRLELGETAVSDSLTITFESVVSDSRCPADVVCVWAGEARVRLTVEGAADTLLVSDPELAPEATVRRGDVTVRAVDLLPYPVSRADERGDPLVVIVRTDRDGS